MKTQGTGDWKPAHTLSLRHVSLQEGLMESLLTKTPNCLTLNNRAASRPLCVGIFIICIPSLAPWEQQLFCLHLVLAAILTHRRSRNTCSRNEGDTELREKLPVFSLYSVSNKRDLNLFINWEQGTRRKKEVEGRVERGNHWWNKTLENRVRKPIKITARGLKKIIWNTFEKFSHLFIQWWAHGFILNPTGDGEVWGREGWIHKNM